jgi:RNA polymerase sigma factor (sigma-70 family)
MSVRADLKSLFIARYAQLLKRLEYKIGSSDRAADALQEMWLRLETMPETGPIANAEAYILGVASNVAIDQYRAEHRHVYEEEVDELFQIEDDLADPERIIAARRKVDTMKVILRELPARRRAILWAARVDGQLNREIARQFGVSLRTVEKELAEGLNYCVKRMRETANPAQLVTKGRRKF